jgi:hypothetical protein
MEKTPMRRDLELVKAICLEVEGKRNYAADEIVVAGAEPWVVARHVELMVAVGLLDGAPGPQAIDGQKVYLVRDLTSFGHDFVGTLRDAGIWTQLKTLFPEEALQNAPLRVVAGTAIRLSEIAVQKAAGLAVDTH